MKINICCKILDISPQGLTRKIINDAYTLSALRHHPDKHIGQTLEEQSRQEKLFKLAGDAKKLLTEYLQTGKKPTGESAAASQDEQTAAGGGAPKRAQAAPYQDCDFPSFIHIIQDSSNTEELRTFRFTLHTNLSRRINIAISNDKNNSLLDPRVVIEALLTIYLANHPEITLSKYISLLKKEKKGAPETLNPSLKTSVAALILINRTQALSKPPILTSLSAQEIQQLADHVGVRWISCGKIISATMPKIPLEEFLNLAIGGHIVINRKPQPTQAPVEKKGTPLNVSIRILSSGNQKGPLTGKKLDAEAPLALT